jgi:hypothetical protein
LAEVELCEGLVEIGERSFAGCDHSITKINIPTSLRRINVGAFHYSLRCPICLHDDIESIGSGAFNGCIFTNFRVPPLITVIPDHMLIWCKALFSLEISDNTREIKDVAFYHCFCLRNPDDVFGDNIFFEEDEMALISDLQQLFGSNARIISELQH